MTNTKLDEKPIVIGLYDISGCGKTYLRNQLEQMLPREQYLFFEGSEVLSNLVPGGLDVLSRASHPEHRPRVCR
jgi:adenylylsulfate kinase-like enzyme